MNVINKMMTLTIVFLLIVYAAYFVWSQFVGGTYELVIEDDRDKTEYVRIPLEQGAELQFSWVHSVELTPWIETLIVSGTDFHLVETRFQSFGAGVPQIESATTYVKDGFTVMTDFKEVHDNYRWIHSHQAQHQLMKSGEIIVETTSIPHHRPIVMRIEKR